MSRFYSPQGIWIFFSAAFSFPPGVISSSVLCWEGLEQLYVKRGAMPASSFQYLTSVVGEIQSLWVICVTSHPFAYLFVRILKRRQCHIFPIIDQYHRQFIKDRIHCRTLNYRNAPQIQSLPGTMCIQPITPWTKHKVMVQNTLIPISFSSGGGSRCVTAESLLDKPCQGLTNLRGCADGKSRQ